MKVLVLGSCGQIGKPLVAHLESLGHVVAQWDKVRGADEDLSLVANYDRLCQATAECDAVVFLAFEVGGSKYLSERDSQFSYIHENSMLMSLTFSALEKAKKPFLFASSQMANMLHTNYGPLKLIGERYTQSLGGWTCRFWNAYGYEDPDSPKSHVITDFISMAKRDGVIKMRTSGAEARQFLHVDDCAQAIAFWCSNHQNLNKDEFLDITSHVWTTVAEVAQLIQANIPCIISSAKNEDNLQRGIKNAPNPYFLQFWKPTVSIQEGIRRLCHD